MELEVILSQMTVLFILLAVGYAVGKLKILTPDGNRVLTKVVLFVALPCTILNSVIGSDLNISFGETMYYLLMCTLSFAVAFAVAIPAIRLTRGNRENHGLLTYMSVFSNCGFMGIPVAMAIFGETAGFYAAIFNIPFNLLSFSAGIMLVAGAGRKFNPKLLINPPLIASLLAIPVAFSNFEPPYIVTEAIKLTGNVTTPGAMIVIGSTLAYIPARNIFSEWRVWITTLLRLVIIPLFTWVILRPLIDNTIMLCVPVVLSAMPTAAQSTMFAIEYNGNEKIASSGVFIATLLCSVTIPLLVYLLLL